MKDNNVDTEFTDIDKENKYKDYIIVCILYVIVIILFILLILGVKNQREVIENNIEEEQTIETIDKNENTIYEKDAQEESSLFEDINTITQETNDQIEKNNNSYTNILDELE